MWKNNLTLPFVSILLAALGALWLVLDFNLERRNETKAQPRPLLPPQAEIPRSTARSGRGSMPIATTMRPPGSPFTGPSWERRSISACEARPMAGWHCRCPPAGR